MNEARFLELLAAFGAEFSRWPEGERAAAEQFLAAASHRVRDLWESERSFDRILAVEAAAPATLFLEARILGRLSQHAARTVGSRRFVWRPAQWLAGGALAASAAFGFYVGYDPAGRAVPIDATDVETVYGSGAGEFFLAALADPDQ
jgi:hypothetical protein